MHLCFFSLFRFMEGIWFYDSIIWKSIGEQRKKDRTEAALKLGGQNTGRRRKGRQWGTHIQFKWKPEQENDNYNQGATSHSSCRTLKSVRLEVKGWCSHDTLDNKAI